MNQKFIAIINGPNLNRLGSRDTTIYDDTPFEKTLDEIKNEVADKCAIDFFQSNCEGAIIDMLQKYDVDENCLGIVINPGAYAHYSYAIADAIADCRKPVVEVHISNIFSREDFRHSSVTAAHVSALISGCHRRSYLYGVQEVLGLHRDEDNQ